MALESDEKKLQAQYQCKWEKEAHDLQMLRLHLQYQGVGDTRAGSLPQFGSLAAQFADPMTFGGVGMSADDFATGPLLPSFNN